MDVSAEVDKRLHDLQVASLRRMQEGGVTALRPATEAARVLSVLLSEQKTSHLYARMPTRTHPPSVVGICSSSQHRHDALRSICNGRDDKSCVAVLQQHQQQRKERLTISSAEGEQSPLDLTRVCWRQRRHSLRTFSVASMFALASISAFRHPGCPPRAAM